MDLMKLYSSLLKFSGLEADEQGYISAVIGDRREPTNVDGLRLVLPTHEQLRHFNPTERIIFHPLAENILKTESNVISKFRDVINIRLNYTIGVVMQSLLNLIASPELHKRLNPEQMELLLAIKDADDKTVSNFIQLMIAGMKTKPDRVFINIFLKKAGYKGKDKFSRLAVVAFPFYEQMDEFKIRKKDQETFKQLFEYLFMDVDVKGEYNYGSNSRVAPYLDALMNAAVGLASRLNDTLQMFSEFIEDSEQLLFDAEWLEDFQNLEELLPEIRKIPAHISQNNVVEPVPEPVVYGQQPPVQTQYAYPPAVATAPPGYMPIPGYQPPPQQPPQIVQTERGIDFRSIVQANPTIAGIPNSLMPQLMNQQMMNQGQVYQREPGWVNNPNMLPVSPTPPPGTWVQTPNGYVQVPANPQYQQPMTYPFR